MPLDLPLVLSVPLPRGVPAFVYLADFPLVAVVPFFLLILDGAGVRVQATLVRLRLRVELVGRGRASATVVSDI